MKQRLISLYREVWQNAAMRHTEPRNVLLQLMNEKRSLPLPEHRMIGGEEFHGWLDELSNYKPGTVEHEELMAAKETVALELISDVLGHFRRQEIEKGVPSMLSSEPTTGFRGRGLPDDPLLTPVLERIRRHLWSRGPERTIGEEALYRELLIMEIFTEDIQPHVRDSDVARSPFQLEKAMPFTSTQPGEDVCKACGRPL